MVSVMPNEQTNAQTQANTDAKHPIRVFIVDDHPVVRLGLRQLLAQDPDIEVCGEAEQVKEAIDKLDKARPDVAIVDLALPDANGIDLIKHLKRHWIGVKIIVVSSHLETVYGPPAMEAGANVYINKHEAMDQILQAIHAVYAPTPEDENGPKQKESHWFG